MTVAYTAVVLAEGTGLWLRRAWAEWLTVLATGSLIPFELWELITRPPERRHGRDAGAPMRLASLVSVGPRTLLRWTRGAVQG